MGSDYKYLGDIRQAQAPAQRLGTLPVLNQKAHWLVPPRVPGLALPISCHQLLEVAWSF